MRCNPIEDPSIGDSPARTRRMLLGLGLCIPQIKNKRFYAGLPSKNCRDEQNVNCNILNVTVYILFIATITF